MRFKKKQPIHDVTENLYYQPEQVIAQSHDDQRNAFLGEFVNARRYTLLLSCMVLCFAIVLGKAVYLQVVQGGRYYALAEGNRAKTVSMPFSRGLIYDADMMPLVRNEPVFDITLVPRQLPLQLAEREVRVHELARVVGLDPLHLTETLQNYSALHAQPVVIVSNVAYDESLRYNTLFEEYPELELEVRTQRVYADTGFSHLLGYIGKINDGELAARKEAGYVLNDVVGKTGLELSYEEVLRGRYGYQELEIDSRGRVVKVLSERAAVHGENIQLTIDTDFQDAVYALTKDYLQTVNKRRASVVVMDPRDGAIRAMVSYPEYDNNQFSGGISQDAYDAYIAHPDYPLFDRTIKGEYPSGSTIKMLVGAAALEENVITASTGFMSVGGIVIANMWFFPDWRAGGHGYTTIRKALFDSVNTFFYIVGGGYEDFKGLGLDRLTDYYRQFGLGSVTGIDIPGERPGLVPSREWKWERKKEEWYIGDTYHLAIGQGDILVTPLQVALYTSYFAHGSKMYVPRVVASVIDAQGVTRQQSSEVLKEDVVDSFNTRIIREGMRAAVTEGSARYLSLLPFSSAGKTGTAQFSKTKDPHAWFTGFAPYENPEIVVTVLVEEGGEGSSVAVPLASKIMEYYFGEYAQAEVLPQDN